MEGQKIPVTVRALTQRVNRKLAHKYEKLVKTHARDVARYGDYYIIDTYKNCVKYLNCDLESVGREEGVLKPYEYLAEE